MVTFENQTTDKTKPVFVIILIISLTAAAGFWLLRSPDTTSDNTTKDQKQAAVQDGNPVSMPQKVLANQFGFLSGGEADNPFVDEAGAAWVRPHPGPFLWDAMQTSPTAEIDFSVTDDILTAQQKQNYGTLVTLWPFAEWDQVQRPDAAACAVSASDEFLPDSEKSKAKGRVDYLPLHRCNPHDWEAYATWIQAIVERYDGDGTADMAGLQIPVKYWEVMNEPDLTSPDPISTLDFYQNEPEDYAELLIRTSEAIKTADPEAQVLIAGAAGGNNVFLDFYRTVFEQSGVSSAFDIANVHCISNASYDSFNVEPYQQLLSEYGIDKPIWVTEAEAIMSSDQNINATQTKLSTAKALSLGAEKIFFTRYEFTVRSDLNDMRKDEIYIPIEISGQDALGAYKAITHQ